MIIGVPKEIKKQEYRVALPPSAAYQLVKRGHRVLVEHGAGVGSGFADEEYTLAGASLFDSPSAVFGQAELIVKVKEPQPSEVCLLRRGQLLFTYLHLAADKELTEALIKSGVTAIAYETVEVNGRLCLLEPMSEIAGRMSVLIGGYYLAKVPCINKRFNLWTEWCRLPLWKHLRRRLSSAMRPFLLFCMSEGCVCLRPRKRAPMAMAESALFRGSRG